MLGTTEPISLPLERLKKGQARARFSELLMPPCLMLLMWSTWKPKKASSSWMRQYLQRKLARSLTNPRRSAQTGSAIRQVPTSPSFGQPHQVLDFEVVVQFSPLLGRKAIPLLAFAEIRNSGFGLAGRLESHPSPELTPAVMNSMISSSARSMTCIIPF